MEQQRTRRIDRVKDVGFVCQRRVIDGAMAAKYLATVKELLEKPATLLV